MNRFAKMKKERIYTLFETLSFLKHYQLKDFRAQFRGVLDIKFFLFRVAKIFA